MECEAIQKHNTFAPNGYNVTLGGEGTLGPISEAARARVAAAQKKRFQRPEQLARLLEIGRIGREARRAKNAGTRAKMVEVRAKERVARAAYVRSQEFRAYHSQRTKEAMATPDVREKVMACARARAASPEWRARLSASKKGKKVAPCSEIRKQRIAAARRKEWADPVMREKRLAAFAAARAAKGGRCAQA